MIYLGIDYGGRRIGLAKATSDVRVAIPLKTITYKTDGQILEKLSSIVQEEEIDEIVVGLPISFDGKEHDMAQRVRVFGEDLKKLNVPIHFYTEVLSSKQSMRDGVKDIDASAAALILRSFLDQKM